MTDRGEFSPGDVVRLRSGGPKMTISKWEVTKEAWWCIWFNEKGEPQGHSFDPVLLMHAD